jgi:putative NIF3 family GTP cyclohydrolase 1 type 2
LCANLVISHEPIYYNHLDETGFLEGDPVFEAKRRYLEENRLAVWRFHDHWHLHRPDGIATGFARKMGWSEYRDAEDASLFHIPETSLGEICSRLKARLDITALRVAGDPEMRCATLKVCPGAPGEGPQLEALRNEEIDLVISGESPEWVACEYVRDAAFIGRKKGLIVLGHCHSEEAGMEYLAEWLSPKLGGVRVRFVAAGDPFRHL